MAKRFRKTVRRSVSVRGIGLHTGEQVTATLHPAEGGTGILFRLGKGKGATIIPALVPFVTGTHRRVTLGREGVKVETVEHLLATLWGMGVTDVIVEVSGSELPIGDGSGLIWMEAITDVGTEDLDETLSTLVITKPLTVTDEKASLEVLPSRQFCVHYTFITDHPLVGKQEAFFDEGVHQFPEEVAPARTFGFIEEVTALWEKGLALGGSLENAIVIYPDGYSCPLRFPNELARHKLLDLMGDFALLGRPLRASIVAFRSGHTLHHRACQILWRRMVRRWMNDGE